jgi:hypothetical protein
MKGIRQSHVKEEEKKKSNVCNTHTKRPGKPKGKRKDKTQLDVTCENCKKPGHAKSDCYSKGGRKECKDIYTLTTVKGHQATRPLICQPLMCHPVCASCLSKSIVIFCI